MASTKPFWQRIDWRGLSGPILVILILMMMVLPLPPILLDFLFTFNIASALLVLLVSIYTVRVLDFAVFPTILLLTTLLRLSLNVASTRVILLHGHGGEDAAGAVIAAFGHFLIGGNYAVGLIVFAILMVINFVVITKGAGRIAEVGARFTLDAMPGKQMAIDADLNAGLIGEDEARKRRAEVSQEADFFGAMDGASKFVRGDAIAGILILFINLLGGLIVGVAQHSLALADAARTYTLLSIGDGLVAQIPALIISTAAGIVVSRVTTGQDISRQLGAQLFVQPQALIITGGLLVGLGLIPGMPHLAFLLLGGGILAGGLLRAQARPVAETAPTSTPAAPADVSLADIEPVHRLSLAVGYRLIPLVDTAQQGELLDRIRAVRRRFAQELGFLVPPVQIRDSLDLPPGGYRVALSGADIAHGEVFPGQLLAIASGPVLSQLTGTSAKDPAFGMPGTWIRPEHKAAAMADGYTVVDASTVVATHLSRLIQQHAAELLGREETQQLLDHLARSAPKLVEEVVPKLLPVGTVQKIFQDLLAEGVSLRDLRAILEALAEAASQTVEPAALLARVRIALKRQILQPILGDGDHFEISMLAPEVEQLLLKTLQGQAGGDLIIEPGMAETLFQDVPRVVATMEEASYAPVLVVPPPLRTPLAKFLRRANENLVVLSSAELLEDRQVQIHAVLGAG